MKWGFLVFLSFISFCSALQSSSRCYLPLCFLFEVCLPRFDCARLKGCVLSWERAAIWKGFLMGLLWLNIAWFIALLTFCFCQLLKGERSWKLGVLLGEGAGGGMGGGADWKNEKVVCLENGEFWYLVFSCLSTDVCVVCDESCLNSDSFQRTILFVSLCGDFGGEEECLSWCLTVVSKRRRCCRFLVGIVWLSSSSVRSTVLSWSKIVACLLFFFIF